MIPILPDHVAVGLRDAGTTYELASESAVTLLTQALGVGVAQTTVIEYQENAAVPSGSETTVLSYTVPAGKTLWIRAWAAWGDVDAEYFVKIDGVQKDGYRTTIARIVAAKSYSQPLEVLEGETVAIRCLRQSSSVALPFKASMQGVLNG